MSAELIDPDGYVPLRPNIHPVMNCIGHRFAAGFPQNPITAGKCLPGVRSQGDRAIPRTRIFVLHSRAARKD